jgi:hypothetical protein
MTLHCETEVKGEMAESTFPACSIFETASRAEPSVPTVWGGVIVDGLEDRGRGPTIPKFAARKTASPGDSGMSLSIQRQSSTKVSQCRQVQVHGDLDLTVCCYRIGDVVVGWGEIRIAGIRIVFELRDSKC